MASNGPEPSRTDIYPYIRDWRARIAATKPPRDRIGTEELDVPCGGVIGVALVWFAAGIIVAAAALTIAITV